MTCTKEEIEKKRLAALQKRQNKLETNSLPFNSNRLQEFNSPIRSSFNNAHKSFKPYARSNVTSNVPKQCIVPVDKVVTAAVYLISEDRFEVHPSEFCSPLINIFSTILSKRYDPKTKLWNFSTDHYHDLISKVAPLAPHIVIGGLPSYVLQVLKEKTMDPKNVDLTPVESTLRNKLLPFQQDGVRFGIARRGRCMIADDMGLGKTYQALAIASYYRHNWPVLIVTTSSMRETWQSKIQELLPSVPMMNIVTLSTGKDTYLFSERQTEVAIVSYKIASMFTDLLKSMKFGVVIIDESQHLKSPAARCTRALRAASGGAARVLLLSGTPALSRPAELYTQLSLIDNKLFPSYTEYGKRYCNGKQTNFGWDMTGQSNLPELQVLLQKKFLIRRTKEQVLTDLEAKTREAVLLDQTLLQYSPEDQKGLSQMEEVYKSSKKSDKHSALITYFSESARVKIPAICKYIKQLLDKPSTEKFLVFAHHKIMIDAICETLDERNVHYIRIVGSTPTTIRADLVEKFQHDPTCLCAVLSITAANAGITLTAADLVLFAELHWNPGVLSQAEARAHRLGRRGAVRARYLLAARTADDHMWPMLHHKLNVLNDAGLSGDTFEDTTTTHQESKTNMAQYLTQLQPVKNKNDYIPGTNIRKDEERKNKMSAQPGTSHEVDAEKSFFEDDETDDILANLDL